MCPPDAENPDKKDEEPSGAAGPSASEETNRIVGPLTHEELRAGGMDRVIAYVRGEPSNDARRQRRRRKKQEKKGRRQMNVTLRDDERSRETIRATAKAIEDEATHQAVETILKEEAMRPLIVDIASQPPLRHAVQVLSRSTPSQWSTLIQLALSDCDILNLIQRMTATARRRHIVKAALDNPGSVALGLNLMTGHRLCLRLVRSLLGIRRRRPAAADGAQIKAED